MLAGIPAQRSAFPTCGTIQPVRAPQQVYAGCRFFDCNLIFGLLMTFLFSRTKCSIELTHDSDVHTGVVCIQARKAYSPVGFRCDFVKHGINQRTEARFQ